MSAKSESQKIVEMWRRWREKNGGIIAKRTISSFVNALVTYIEWMQSNGYSFAGMDRERWVSYCNYASERTDFAVEYRRHKIRVAMTILHYLFDVNAIRDFDTSIPRRAKVNVSKTNSPLPLIPVYKDIQRLRQTEMRLEDAMTFEVALSSGLRSDELKSVRLCDINFNKHATDKSTGAPSIYSGGTVTVCTLVSSTKGKRDRVTHLGRLAARLVKLYARVNGVKLDSQVPLVLSQSRLRSAISVVNDNIEWKSSIGKSAYQVETASVSELGDDFMLLPDAMKRSYLARVKREAEAIHRPDCRKEKTSITCHSLRYFFASLMLYRTYAGHRNALERVSRLLGHSSTMTTTRYVLALNPVESDADWAHVMNGTSSSWINVMMNNVSDRRCSK